MSTAVEPDLRIVVDTGVLVSALYGTHSVPLAALQTAYREHIVITSRSLSAEIGEVLSRPKFVRRFGVDTLLSVLETYDAVAVYVEVTTSIRDCRDPKDDMLLALALDGSADLILTGDLDLLVLHPWRGIDILTPAEFLSTYAANT